MLAPPSPNKTLSIRVVVGGATPTIPESATGWRLSVVVVPLSYFTFWIQI